MRRPCRNRLPRPACQDGDAHTTLPFAGEFTRAYALQVTLRRALARAERAATLDAGEVAGLLAARGDDLQALCEIASRVCATASVTRSHIRRRSSCPVTHLCRDRCHCCTFCDRPATLRRQGRRPSWRSTMQWRSPGEVRTPAAPSALLTWGTPRRIAGPRHFGWTRADSTAPWTARARCGVAILERAGCCPRQSRRSQLGTTDPSATGVAEHRADAGDHQPAPLHDPRAGPRLTRTRTRWCDCACCATPKACDPLDHGAADRHRRDSGGRAESCWPCARGQEFHGIQEVIIQNFRAKPGTAMARVPDCGPEEYLAAVATARVVLRSSGHLQAPPTYPILKPWPDCWARESTTGAGSARSPPTTSTRNGARPSIQALRRSRRMPACDWRHA